MSWTDSIVKSAGDIISGIEDTAYTLAEHPWYSTTGAMVGSLFALRLYCRYTVGICRCTTEMTGKIVAITGGNSGIGKEAATELARRNATVIIGCRNKERGEKAVKDIKALSGNQKVQCRQLDLCSFASVRRFSDSIRENEGLLHILVNNAGVTGTGPGGKRLITEDGCEHMMQANYFGHFLLTLSLTDLLKASAHSRIINVSSMSHKWGKLDLDDLDSKNFNATDTYNKSKLANLLFTKAMAKRLAGTGVTVNALNPGVVKTEIARNTPAIHGFISKVIFGLVGKTPLEGAQTILHLALSPELENVSGEYFRDCKRQAAAKAEDEELAEKLFKISEDIVGLKMKTSR